MLAQTGATLNQFVQCNNTKAAFRGLVGQTGVTWFMMDGDQDSACRSCFFGAYVRLNYFPQKF